MQSIDLIEIYIIYIYTKLINFDVVIEEIIKELNPNWLQIPDHPYKIKLVGGSGSGKPNSLFNLKSQQPDIDNI